MVCGNVWFVCMWEGKVCVRVWYVWCAMYMHVCVQCACVCSREGEGCFRGPLTSTPSQCFSHIPSFSEVTYITHTFICYSLYLQSSLCSHTPTVCPGQGGTPGILGFSFSTQAMWVLDIPSPTQIISTRNARRTSVLVRGADPGPALPGAEQMLNHH